MCGSVSKKKLKESVEALMKSLNLFDAQILDEIPNSWEKYGNLVLFNGRFFTSHNWFVAGDDLWSLICDLLKCDRIGLKGPITQDDFRSPKVSLVYGEPGEVTFNDNGIKYSWNLERCMFSRGNACERHRIASLDCSNEVIVDLFAGIGYFTLPYLVKAKAKFVHACDWNPHAIKSLRKNLKLNNVSERCLIYEGDNRLYAPKSIGHRINVGLIPDSEDFWKTACEALIHAGGIIYIHQNVTSGISNDNHNSCTTCNNLITELNFNDKLSVTVVSTQAFLSEKNCINWKREEWFKFALHVSHELLNYLEEIHKAKWKVTVKEYFKIKSYAPHIDHLVYSAFCFPMREKM